MGTLTLHYVRNHRPIIEMERLTGRTNLGLSNPLTTNHAMHCPFVLGTMQICPKLFLLRSKEDLHPMSEHILRHIHNSLTQKVKELIQLVIRAYPYPSNNGCPLSYCYSDDYGGWDIDHFLQHHRLEISLYILRTISTEEKHFQLMKPLLEEEVIDFLQIINRSKSSLQQGDIKQETTSDSQNLENPFAYDVDNAANIMHNLGEIKKDEEAHELLPLKETERVDSALNFNSGVAMQPYTGNTKKNKERDETLLEQTEIKEESGKTTNNVRSSFEWNFVNPMAGQQAK